MKIIILNNSSDMQETIVSFLKKFKIANNEIFTFDNGFEALDFIKRNGADIVFSDIEMPYMEGFEFAEIVLKLHPKLKNSFFAISSDENYDSYKKMEKNGVHRFLKKPIDYRIFEDFMMPEILRVRFIEEDLSATDIRYYLNQTS